MSASRLGTPATGCRRNRPTLYARASAVSTRRPTRSRGAARLAGGRGASRLTAHKLIAAAHSARRRAESARRCLAYEGRERENVFGHESVIALAIRSMPGHVETPNVSGRVQGGSMSAHFDEVKSALDSFCAAWQANDGQRVAGCFVE